MGCSMYRRLANWGIRLRRRDQILWVVSILLATALTVSGMHAKNAAELRHGEAGLYRLMPGIILGLLTGFLLDSPTVVLIVTIAANAAVYCFVFKGLFWLYGKASRR
ncbi:MAG: hypothetical protein AUG83_06810 [Acidobacteria bacterium 13_1_20CM_4_57_11]|nr:MAG: hypothetical protein AUG83_06810 [Acidobacteria bacterium 13_1_20CM_4_57_11]